MNLTHTERAERREAFRRMSAAQKAEYIASYYKLPIVLTLLFAYVLCYGAYRHFSRKEVALYVMCANVAVSDGTADVLSEGFLRFRGMDVRKNETYLYHNLYFSDNPSLANHEYAYASRLKLLAAVNAEQADVVLMNREAYRLLSEGGYLLELSSCLSGSNPDLYRRLRPCLVENKVILEDNGIEVALGEADSYRAAEICQTNALDVSRFPAFLDANFTDSVFLGVIRNSPRVAVAMEYIAYLDGTAARDSGGN